MEEKETPTRVESPYVEIDLDEAKVFFIIPKQQFETTTVNNIPQQLHYKLELNGDKQTISVRVSGNKQGIAIAEEKRINLEQSLKDFRIVYPDELQGRVYSYQHSNEILYPFIAIGNNCGRMHYLYDKHGNFNALPKREIWLLIDEDFDLASEPDNVGESWIWEKYRPININLKEINQIIVKNKRTGKEVKIPCESAFSIEGDELVEDDFKEQSPLFAGNSIKIKAPTVNPSGWVIWIQNKQAGYKVTTENWTGDKPLELKLPDDLPCECGEFQVDICEQEDRIPIETLFFRYIPYLQLEFPRDLIIPDPNNGHKQEIIRILFEKDFQDWELKHEEAITHKNIENGYQIELPPQRDFIHFSLMKQNKAETETTFKITISRLKWRTSKQKTWNDKPQNIKREELIWGEDFYLFICLNDFNIRYNLLAVLETNSYKLKEAKFTRKGLQYIMRLNEFYDTIKQNKDTLTLKVEIRKADDNRLLGIPEILHFEGVVQKPLPPKSISYDLINILSLPKICFILRRIKATCPKEKPVCKDILQIYYQNIRGGKRTKRDVSMDKKDFVIKALSFIKFIMDSYGKKVSIKGQKKWRKWIDFLQQKYPEEFNNANDTFSRR